MNERRSTTLEQPNHEPEQQPDGPKDDHLDVTAQYGGGKEWVTAPSSGIRGWWRRFRGE